MGEANRAVYRSIPAPFDAGAAALAECKVCLSGPDFVDPDFDVHLPVTGPSPRILSPPQFLHKNLRIEADSQDLGRNGGSIDLWTTRAEAIFVRNREDFFELDRLPLGNIAIVDLDLLTLFDLILATAVFNNCVHFPIPSLGANRAAMAA